MGRVVSPTPTPLSSGLVVPALVASYDMHGRAVGLFYTQPTGHGVLIAEGKFDVVVFSSSSSSFFVSFLLGLNRIIFAQTRNSSKHLHIFDKKKHGASLSIFKYNSAIFSSSSFGWVLNTNNCLLLFLLRLFLLVLLLAITTILPSPLASVLSLSLSLLYLSLHGPPPDTWKVMV